MRLELSAENPVHGGYYYAELLLPAADYEIKDANKDIFISTVLIVEAIRYFLSAVRTFL